MTQEKLADRSGLSVRAISNLERGRTARPHPRSLKVLAVGLGLPETVGTAWATRLRADQSRDSSPPAPQQLPSAGGRLSLPHTAPAAAAPDPASGRPIRLPIRPQGRGLAMALAPLAKGDPSRIGPFRLLSRLGGGAMGEVFLAAGGGRAVAVKRVRAEYARDAVFRARSPRRAVRLTTPEGPGSVRGC